MKLAKLTLLASLALSVMASFLLFPATGCKKATEPNPIQPALSPEQVKQQRLAWNLKTLVEAYEKAGHTSPKWDGPARIALAEFAHIRARCIETNETWEWIISTNCIAAMDAGCNDPMIQYLYVRFGMNQTNSAQAFTGAYCQVALEMEKSSYPSIRKFYAAQRAVEQLFNAYGTNSINAPFLQQVQPLVGENLLPAIADKTMPAEEAFEACDAALSSMKGATNAYGQAYHAIENPLFENWPDAYTSWLLKGKAYAQMAWDARGFGFANTVTKEGWKQFNERLATAEAALEHAWKLNPKDPEIALQMMTVMLGQGGGRERMELWFDRAMALDPNDYDACYSKLYYLEPKWHGSREAMLAFARECVRNTNWGGRVPLILADAHWSYCRGYIDKSAQTNYWKQPDVWPDIKMSYDRFLGLNPEETRYYHTYAKYAYQCEQWNALNELIPKLDPINYDYFGGKDEFDKMVQIAKEHSTAPK